MALSYFNRTLFEISHLVMRKYGKDSFNIAAGMARLHTAAGFVKAKMPLGQVGSLTDDEAWDVGAYFSQQPRPDYPEKIKDWSKGGKPADARY